MELSEIVEEVIHYQRFKLFGYEAHKDTIMLTWMVIGYAFLFCILMRKQLKVIPGPVQFVLEMLVESFDSLSSSMVGEKKGKRYVPFIMSIFLFVLSCNWLGLIPGFVKIGHLALNLSPTRDISTTVALAIFSFMAFQYFGYREKGIKYVLHYFYPIPMLIKALPRYLLILIPPLFCLFVFLNIVEEIARILSLSVRLMGNILGEHIVASSLLLFFLVVLQMSIFLCPLADILPLFVMFLGLLTGAIQAFIFAVLTLSYIAHAVEEEH